MIGQEDQGQEVQAKAAPQFFDPFESVGTIVTIPRGVSSYFLIATLAGLSARGTYQQIPRTRSQERRRVSPAYCRNSPGRAVVVCGR